MRRTKNIVIAIVVVVVLLVLFLFYVQNQDTKVVLYLDLFAFAPMKLREPTSVPLLMLASFGAGLVLMGIYTLFEIFRREGRNRRARRDLSRMSDRMRDDPNFDEYESDF